MEIDSQYRFRRMLAAAECFEEKWRRENEDHFRYYDGEQWSEEEKRTLALRGQPPVVVNLTAAMIDMVRALEVQQRVDIQVVGREESDDDMATLLTALLKQVFDRAQFDYFLSRAFQDAMIGGRGWIKLDVKPDTRGKDQIQIDYIPWEEVYLDPFSIKPDASDARYIVRVKWMDRDVAKMLFPGSEEVIDSRFDSDAFEGQEHEAQMNASDRGLYRYYDYRNQRIKICECWYTKPVRRMVEVTDEMTSRKKSVEVFDHEVHRCVFSDDIILEGSALNDAANENPLKINMIPLVPLVCSKDRHGHPVGMVKNMVGIQDVINKLNSKLIHKFGTRQVIAEASAVQDPEDLRQEMQRPDGLAVLNEGGLSKVKVDYNTEDMGYISNHMGLMLSMLQRETGVNDSTLGFGGVNERSGVIQSSRIAQGNSLHTPKLENIQFCKRRVAYIALRLMGAYYTDYRVLRVTQPNGMTESYAFNQPEIDPETGKPVRILHQIEDTLEYDVVLKKVPPFDSIRARQLVIFSEVLKTGVIAPEIAAEILLSLLDIPNKEDILRRTQMMAQQQQDMAAQQQALDMAQQKQQMALDAQAAQAGM